MPSDCEALRAAVMRSRDALNGIVDKAEKRFEEMEQEFRKKLKEQEDIVKEAVELRNAYNRESLEWDQSANRALPPGSTYPIKQKIGKYSKGRGTLVARHYPWLATPPPPPPPARKPKREIRIINDDSSEEEGDEVAVTGERSWAERDRALRAKAIPLESCVDEVFRNFNVSIR